jgi:hypothetical protein
MIADGPLSPAALLALLLLSNAWVRSHPLQVPGLIITDHTFKVPLDHSGKVAGEIDLFVREVVAPVNTRRTNLPYLLYLQGAQGKQQMHMQLTVVGIPLELPLVQASEAHHLFKNHYGSAARVACSAHASVLGHQQEV